MKSDQPRVLFVGSFRPSSDGTQGGQMVACTTLVNSHISAKVKWILLDSTASTNHHRSFIARLWPALMRLVRFLFHLLFSRVDTVLLFCSGGYSFREKGMMAIMAHKLGKKVILAPRSGLIKNDVDNSDSFKHFLVRVLNHTTVLLCQGPSWKTYYSSLAENTKLDYRVVHNWIDPLKVKDVVRSVGETPETRVLFLGWITENKGVFDIVKAAEQLNDPGIVFNLGGHGDGYSKVAKLVETQQSASKINLLGWVIGPEKIDLLNQADVFLLPSYREGYPNAIIEAMSCSIPVVASRVGSIPDIIEDGVNGYLIRPGHPEDITASIRKLHANKEKMRAMGIAAQKTVDKNNQLDTAVNKIYNIIVN